MNNQIFNKVALILIISLSFFLRFWRLGDYPALNADEAAIGYNAYSLIETGKDEHGNSWPLHFQSFNDYKPGLYVYMVLPFVKLFGLNEWAVRVPNALLGALSVFVLYLLIRNLKIADSSKIAPGKSTTNFNEIVELLAPAMLAINPWHIHFSRGGWEVNTSTFLILLGTLFYIKYINSKIITQLFLSSLAFSLSFYTYHSARIIVPLIMFGLIGIYYKEFKNNFRSFVLAGLLGLVALSPLIKDFTKPEVSSRATGVGILADLGPTERANEQRGEHGNFNGTTSKLLHNKLVNYSLSFFENYTEHFHGLFLFLSGDDIERDKVPETGQMYMLDFLWILCGLWWMVKNWNKENRLIIHWLLVAPVAASLTFQSPHALRAQNMVIPIVFIGAIGFTSVLEWVKKRYSRNISLFIYLIIISLSLWQFLRYMNMYYRHMSKEYPYSSQYGVKELVNRLASADFSDFDNVVVTTRYDQPYILFLFYTKYPPSKFQASHELTAKDRFGFSTVSSFEKYIFKPIHWDSDRTRYPNSLIIGAPGEIPDEANVVERIYGTNGFEYFDIVAN